MEFEYEFGSYPSDPTIPKLITESKTTAIPLGTSTANEYFRQLMVAGILDDETCFLGVPGRKPDNVCVGSRAIEKGECTYAYINDVSPKSLPETPLVVYPLIKGKLIFDYKLCKQWGGKVAILRNDNSVVTLPVDKSGHVYLNGKDLFDPSQQFWGGKAPDVKWPE